jgi:aspartate aminotransferase
MPAERKSKMPVSDKIRKDMAQGSWIRRMFDEGTVLKQRYGADKVFDLSLGNPIVEPPAEFHKELLNLARNPSPGMHRYMENAGYLDTRAAIAKQLASETGLKFGPGDVVMTCGAAGALNVALKAILNPGEEVILFAPYFVEYVGYIDNHGGAAKILPTDDKFLPRLDVLEAGINKKTKALIINSPNNPTGVVYSDSLLKQMGEVLRRKEAQYGTEIFILSDEPYRKLIYDGLKMPFPVIHHPRSVVIYSHSKDLALPGERIGYAAINPDYEGKEELMNGFIYCNRVLGFVNAPALMQNVIRGLQNVSVSVDDYQKKRDFLYTHLKQMGYSLNKPEGAFYMFPKTPVADDVAFVRELQEYQVLTVPGRGFGTEGYFRLSYCTTDKVLEGSLEGFRKAAKKFGLS